MIDSDFVAVSIGLEESVTRTLKVAVWATVGVPKMRPAAVPSLSPCGSFAFTSERW